MPRIEPFEQHPDQYERWFERHPKVFAAEVKALRAVTPRGGRGLEVGVGTGRFAQVLGIEEGVDPSPEMRRRAQKRGIHVQDGVAEDLPYSDDQFDYVLLVTTICFVDDVKQALAEAYRVLKPTGALVVGMVDREHPLGQTYQTDKEEHAFYHAAHFHATDEVVAAMRAAGFQSFAFRQTLFHELDAVNEQEPIASGYGEGAFVVIRGRTPLSDEEQAQSQSCQREIRHNRVTGRDVIIAPSRGSRPRETEAVDAKDESHSTADCPFCPGHEERLPYVIDEQSALDDKPWQTRVVPNKYAALDAAPPTPASTDPFFPSTPAYGRQEVIIETPDHNCDLADMAIPELATVIETYQQRCKAIRAEDETLVPFIFRNYGGAAGASLRHPHSQLIAPPQVPKAVQAEEQRVRTYFKERGRCLFCDLQEREAEDPRVVHASERFLAIVPFAAEVPFEVMIVPRMHRADFVGIGAEARAEFARALRSVLQRLRDCCANPPYNYFIRTPVHEEDRDAPHLHWYLRLMPRTKVQAGFELSTDLRVNPSSPEADAARLRGEEEV